MANESNSRPVFGGRSGVRFMIYTKSHRADGSRIPSRERSATYRAAHALLAKMEGFATAAEAQALVDALPDPALRALLEVSEYINA